MLCEEQNKYTWWFRAASSSHIDSSSSADGVDTSRATSSSRGQHTYSFLSLSMGSLQPACLHCTQAGRERVSLTTRRRSFGSRAQEKTYLPTYS